MIQFDIYRFTKLARWTLTIDKKYHVKSFFQNLVVFTLVFVFFTSITFTVNRQAANYVPCSIATIVAFAVTLVLGSSFMFYSMSGKHDMQSLLMLPASNLEKYLVRYASWIILVPIQLAAFFAADLIQYVFGLAVGHEGVRFVTSATIEYVERTWYMMQIPEDAQQAWIAGVVFSAVWVHSCYALGATFFRSHKYNWVLTSAVLVFVFMLLMIVFGWGTVGAAWWNNRYLFSLLMLLLVVLNFWLSYRLFCRTQVIGRFVNI